MHTTTLLTTLFAVLTAAGPIIPRQSNESSTYYGVGLEFQLRFPDGTPYYEPSPVELNQLTQVPVSGLYQISLDPKASNVDVDAVECRAYRDAAGVVPGSAPFSREHPALISTTGGSVASVLCYVTGQE